jgi:hypothetical protein
MSRDASQQWRRGRRRAAGGAEPLAALADPKLKARLADLGSVPMPMTPADFGRLIAEETEKWAKVVKFSGAKAN